MSNSLQLPCVKQRRHSNSSFERRKRGKLETLSIPPRAPIPTFLVGQQTAALFAPLEYDLAQIYNREANVNRSRSRTGSLTSGIYGELPLSAVCGLSPTLSFFDEPSSVISKRPPLGESLKSWPQIEHLNRNLARAISRKQKAQVIVPSGVLDASAFSDTSSDYSPQAGSKRDSWQSVPGPDLQPALSAPSNPTTPSKSEGGNDSVTLNSPASRNSSILSPLATRPTRPSRLVDGVSAGLENLYELKTYQNTDGRPDLAARNFSDEDTRSLQDILNATEEDHARWLAVSRNSDPPSIKQHDEILHALRKKHPLPAPSAPSKYHQPLKILTKPIGKRSQVTWSPSIPKRANSILEGARDVFTRGVDEFSSPATSRSGQSFLLSPSTSYTPSPITPNVAPTRSPEFNSTSRAQFSPVSPIAEEGPHSEYGRKTRASPLSKSSGPFNSANYSRKKFGWNAKHPLKSPHPQKENFATDTFSTIINTAIRIRGLSSSRNEKDRKNSTTVIANHQRSNRGPDTPFPNSNLDATMIPVTHLSYDSLSDSPMESPPSGIVGSFKNVLGAKRREERQNIELERLREEREARRRDILNGKGIRMMGEVPRTPGSFMDGPSLTNGSISVAADHPPVPMGRSLSVKRGERTDKASRILGLEPALPTRSEKAKLEEIESPTLPETNDTRISKVLANAPTGISSPLLPVVQSVDPSLMLQSAVSIDGTVWV